MVSGPSSVGQAGGSFQIGYLFQRGDFGNGVLVEHFSGEGYFSVEFVQRRV